MPKYLTLKKLMVAAVLLSGTVSLADISNPFTTRKVARRVRIATQALSQVMASSRAIPPVVYAQTRCVAALRSVKTGFIFGGEGSFGLVSCRVGDGWSLPSFLNIGGPNFGLQIGVSISEVLLAFVTDAAKDVLLGPSVHLGVDAGYALGPVGSSVGAGWTPAAPVLGYVKNTGFWAGLKVDALVLSQGAAGNQEAYGADALPATILSTPVDATSPSTVTEFPTQLHRYDPQ